MIAMAGALSIDPWRLSRWVSPMAVSRAGDKIGPARRAEIIRDDRTGRSIQENKRHANQENKQPHSSVALKNSRYWTRPFFRFCETHSSIADAVSREGSNETR